jgi:pyridoxal phosphate enzyme (YggS family)
LRSPEELAEGLESVQKRIVRAAESCSRDPAEVTLIAVSKTQPAATVTAAVRAGVTDLGENRVQEAVRKRPEVSAARWHLIGPLQRNKVKPALQCFDVIHTVDRPELATRLQRLLAEHWPERTLPVLLEVNIGDEEQKAGVRPDQVQDLLDVATECDRLQVEGLMAIPPFATDPEATRPHFRALRGLRDRLQDATGHALPQLSIGMSNDFEVAISEGATMVRVGTAIFGPRSYPKRD